MTDPRTNRCGHNFPPRECPYTACGYREALGQLEKCEAALKRVIEWMDANGYAKDDQSFGARAALRSNHEASRRVRH